MKATILTRFGPPDVLVIEEIKKLSIEDNQVLIKTQVYPEEVIQ